MKVMWTVMKSSFLIFLLFMNGLSCRILPRNSHLKIKTKELGIMYREDLRVVNNDRYIAWIDHTESNDEEILEKAEDSSLCYLHCYDLQNHEAFIVAQGKKDLVVNFLRCNQRYLLFSQNSNLMCYDLQTSETWEVTALNVDISGFSTVITEDYFFWVSYNYDDQILEEDRNKIKGYRFSDRELFVVTTGSLQFTNLMADEKYLAWSDYDGKNHRMHHIYYALLEHWDSIQILPEILGKKSYLSLSSTHLIHLYKNYLYLLMTPISSEGEKQKPVIEIYDLDTGTNCDSYLTNCDSENVIVSVGKTVSDAESIYILMSGLAEGTDKATLLGMKGRGAYRVRQGHSKEESYTKLHLPNLPPLPDGHYINGVTATENNLNLIFFTHGPAVSKHHLHIDIYIRSLKSQQLSVYDIENEQLYPILSGNNFGTFVGNAIAKNGKILIPYINYIFQNTSMDESEWFYPARLCIAEVQCP